MAEGTFLYFAYGSNMLSARLKDPTRCPSAKAVGVARFEGHQLRWHKVSSDGSGKCNVVPVDSEGAQVLGVLFEISSSEKAALDQAEGVGSGYAEAMLSVEVGGVSCEAVAYLATSTEDSLRPYSWYRAFVLGGAREFSLPADYIAMIEGVEATIDPKRQRHDRNMAIIPEAFR